MKTLDRHRRRPDPTDFAAGRFEDRRRQQQIAEAMPRNTQPLLQPRRHSRRQARQGRAQRGWTGNDWDCLVKLWTRESSWLWYAENASSGAYGIPQSLPADKMAAFGANYRDDAAVQIDWGLWYIAQRYGSPSKAWQNSEQIGWY